MPHTHMRTARARGCTQSVSHCDAISRACGLGLCTRAAAERARHARVRVVLAADAEPAVGAVAPREAAQTNTHTHTNKPAPCAMGMQRNAFATRRSPPPVLHGYGRRRAADGRRAAARRAREGLTFAVRVRRTAWRELGAEHGIVVRFRRHGAGRRRGRPRTGGHRRRRRPCGSGRKRRSRPCCARPCRAPSRAPCRLPRSECGCPTLQRCMVPAACCTAALVHGARCTLQRCAALCNDVVHAATVWCTLQRCGARCNVA